jgi:hypothetical protein
MRINWGYKIMFVYLFFVAGIVFLVVKSSMQKFELVQPDYYADELKFQSVIDATLRAKQIGGTIVIHQEADKLSLQLPAAFVNATVRGNAHLYFAADINKDLTTSFETNSGELTIKLNPSIKGNYTLKLDVEKNGVTYYYEQKIFI